MLNPIYRHQLRTDVERYLKLQGAPDPSEKIAGCLAAAGERLTEQEAQQQSSRTALLVASLVATAYLDDQNPYHIWFLRFVEKRCAEGPDAATLAADLLAPQSRDDLRKWLWG